MSKLEIFRRGFTIVFLTATNVILVTHGFTIASIVTGGMLSWVWWGNAHRASIGNTPGNRLAYALGAALGTGVGQLTTELILWLSHQT